MNARHAGNALALGSALFAMSGAVWAAMPGCEPMTGLQVAAGYVTFANIVKLIAVLAGAGFGWMFFGGLVKHLLLVFVTIPLAVYKGLGYLVSIAMLLWAYGVVGGHGAWVVGAHWSALDDLARYVGVVGALGLGASVLVSLGDWAKIHGAGPHPEQTSAMILAVLFGAIALTLNNNIVGAFAVAALMGFFGFFIVAMPGVVALGYDDEKTLFSGTLASFLILVPATLTVAHQGSLGPLDVFRAGIFWVTTFSGYTGLLVLATFHFSRHVGRYVLMQAVMILMGLAALYFGSVYGIGELQKIGGTFFVVYLLSKPWDLPKANVMVWSGLGLFTCVVLFLLMREVGQHPAQWGAWLLF